MINGLKKISELSDAANFKEAFPDISTELLDKLYIHPDSWDGIIYMDVKNKVLFETKIFLTKDGFKLVIPAKSNMTASEAIEISKQHYMENFQKGNIDYLEECMVPGGCRADYKEWLDITN